MSGAVGVSDLLEGKEPCQVGLRTRERIIALLEEDEANTLDGTGRVP